MQILPSIGAFIGRVNGRDHRAFLGVADALDADAYEFLMYETFYDRLDPILGDFLVTGLSFPVFHAEKRIGELLVEGDEGWREAARRFAVNCRAARRLGADKLVLHLWNGLPSDNDFLRHVEAYLAFREVATAEGLLLTVENVVCAVSDPLSRFFELLAADPSAAFTYDTKMAAHHRQEYSVFSEPYRALFAGEGGIRHIHLNDYGGTPGDFSGLATLHLGEGNLDIPRIARSLLDVGYDASVTLECGCMRPDGVLLPEKMNASLAIARRLLGGERKTR